VVYIINYFTFVSSKNKQMKTTTLFMVLVFFLGAHQAKSNDQIWKSQAQSILDKMPKSATANDWMQASAKLTKIANEHKEDWTIQYQAAFSTSLYAMRLNDLKKRDEQLDLALKYVDAADKLKPSESEILLLNGYILGMKISIDPAKRGMEMGIESSNYYKQAEGLNPDNPRVYLAQGEAAMYTPEQYGGGKDVAKQLFMQALEKYKIKKPIEPLYPTWGEDRAKELLKQC
jgi:hypothetical protein